jgi:hypothetical protein
MIIMPFGIVDQTAISCKLCSKTALVLLADFYALRRDVETASSEHVKEIRASAGLQQLEQELADLELL